MELKTVSLTLLPTGPSSATALTFDEFSWSRSTPRSLPEQVDVSTVSRRNIGLNVPLVSAAMDTVTSRRGRFAMAQHGGLGVIHKNLSIEEQASGSGSVLKRSESGMIVNPITLGSLEPIYEAHELMKKYPHLRRCRSPTTAARGAAGRHPHNRDLRFETN